MESREENGRQDKQWLVRPVTDACAPRYSDHNPYDTDELQKEPRGLLERVRTGWKGEEFGKDAQMPGSATNGFSDLITLSDERIADEIVIVNVKIQ